MSEFEDDEVIVLNVGGERFCTRLVTLCQRPSMLQVMFGGAFADPKPDKRGEFFFDRDPTHFRVLLNFLRTGKIFLPPSPVHQLELLLEAEYFGIDPVASAVKRLHSLPKHYALSSSPAFEEPTRHVLPPLSSPKSPSSAASNPASPASHSAQGANIAANGHLSLSLSSALPSAPSSPQRPPPQSVTFKKTTTPTNA